MTVNCSSIWFSTSLIIALSLLLQLQLCYHHSSTSLIPPSTSSLSLHIGFPQFSLFITLPAPFLSIFVLLCHCLTHSSVLLSPLPPHTLSVSVFPSYFISTSPPPSFILYIPPHPLQPHTSLPQRSFQNTVDLQRGKLPGHVYAIHNTHTAHRDVHILPRCVHEGKKLVHRLPPSIGLVKNQDILLKNVAEVLQCFHVPG